jgi:hypothetical protein
MARITTTAYCTSWMPTARMAILFRETEGTGITVTPLFTEYLSVYGAPQVGDPASATCRLSLFSGVPLVLPGRSNGLRMLMDRAFAQSQNGVTAGRTEYNAVACNDAGLFQSGHARLAARDRDTTCSSSPRAVTAFPLIPSAISASVVGTRPCYCVTETTRIPPPQSS